MSMHDLFSQCALSDPVTLQEIDYIEKQVGQSLPYEYKKLLQFSNGLEGWLGRQQVYVQIWKSESVMANTIACEADRAIPGIILIGSTNTGEAICLDLRKTSGTYQGFFMMPFDPFDWDEAEFLGRTLDEAFTKLQNPFNVQEQ